MYSRACWSKQCVFRLHLGTDAPLWAQRNKYCLPDIEQRGVTPAPSHWLLRNYVSGEVQVSCIHSAEKSYFITSALTHHSMTRAQRSKSCIHHADRGELLLHLLVDVPRHDAWRVRNHQCSEVKSCIHIAEGKFSCTSALTHHGMTTRTQRCKSCLACTVYCGIIAGAPEAIYHRYLHHTWTQI